MLLGCSSIKTSEKSSWLAVHSHIFLPKGFFLSSCLKSKYPSMFSNSFSKTTSESLAAALLEEESPEKSACCEIDSPKEEVGQMVLDRIRLKSEEHSHQNSVMEEVLLDSGAAEIGEVKVSSKIKRRPARLVVPESFSALETVEVVDVPSQKEFEIEGKDFSLASRRGRRNVMEDGYGVITDIVGDSKQAYFGVFDGHGGSAAVNYVAENLGKNIVTALKEFEEANDQSKEAVRKGYFVTDREFLSQDVSSGACAATVLVKDGELQVANVGDCRVVLSRNGVATALTVDHRLHREDERLRIESSGGYVSSQNGVWRVQGSLAVSRAIGDSHLKQWVISEPEIQRIDLTSDCEFLVLASDGLWDKVGNQEAVDMVSQHGSYIESCKKLVDISSSRGNKDDITVMVVDLKNFKRRRD